MNEFALIERYFAPLSADGLRDDATSISIPTGEELVITTDTMIAGVHFIGDENPALVAQKLLRVNLSDLAAKGAQALYYTLNLSLPTQDVESWVCDFAAGLKADQEHFGITLLGGDTTQTQGPVVVSATLYGTVLQGKMLRRWGAKAGDLLCVSGTIGDGAAGLRIAQGKAKVPSERLLKKYQLPEPRLALGLALQNHATACMDISDGLAQDLGHLCRASAVGAKVQLEQVPVSREAIAVGLSEEECVSGGDDYELLFTLPDKTMLETLRASHDITQIGEMVEGELEFTREGKKVTFANEGYRHFS